MDRNPAALPLLTLDFDGVICRPPFGQNLGIHRTFLDPAAPAPPARIYPGWLNGPLDHLRFDARAPMPRVREALETLLPLRRIVIVTGRRTAPTWWLRHHGLEALVDDVVVNDTGLKSPHFKLAALTALGAFEHADDDPRTVQLLAQASATRVFLCDWPRNRDLPYAEAVERVHDLREVAQRITEGRRSPEA